MWSGAYCVDLGDSFPMPISSSIGFDIAAIEPCKVWSCMILSSWDQVRIIISVILAICSWDPTAYACFWWVLFGTAVVIVFIWLFFTAEQLERFVSRSADPRACGNARERRADVKLSSSHAAWMLLWFASSIDVNHSATIAGNLIRCRFAPSQRSKRWNASLGRPGCGWEAGDTAALLWVGGLEGHCFWRGLRFAENLFS